MRRSAAPSQLASAAKRRRFTPPVLGTKPVLVNQTSTTVDQHINTEATVVQNDEGSIKQRSAEDILNLITKRSLAQ